MGEILEKLVDEASQPPPPPPPPQPAVAASLMGALSVNEPAPLLSPALFAPPAPAPVVPPKAPSLDLATFKDVLRELVEDDAFIQELHYRYQDKLQG